MPDDQRTRLQSGGRPYIVLCVVVGQLVGIFWWLHFQGLYDVAKGYEGVTTKGGLSEAWTYMVCILTICLSSIAVVAGVAINLKLWSGAVIEDDLRFLTAEADADGIRSKFGDRQYGMLPSRAMLPLLDVLGRISAEDPHEFSKSNARLQRMMYTYMGDSMLAPEITSALSAMTSDEIERLAQGVSDNLLPVSLLSGPSNFADTLLYGARRFEYSVEGNASKSLALFLRLAAALDGVWLASDYWHLRGERILWVCSIAFYAAVGVFLYRNMRLDDFRLAVSQCTIAFGLILFLPFALSDFLPGGLKVGTVLLSVFVVFAFEYLFVVWLGRSARNEAASLGACVAAVPGAILGASLTLDEFWKLGLFGTDLSSALMIAVSAASYSLIAPLAKGSLAELMARPR